MTEFDQVKVVGKYIGECSDYDKDIHDWRVLLIKGKGDCQASRYAVQYMCQYFGIKAGALRSFDIHGQTLVLADGKYYIVTTGYDMVRSRTYNVSEITGERARQLMETVSLFSVTKEEMQLRSYDIIIMVLYLLARNFWMI